MVAKPRFKNLFRNSSTTTKPINKSENNNNSLVSKSFVSQDISNLKLKNNNFNFKKDGLIEKVNENIENALNENLSITSNDNFINTNKSSTNEIETPSYKKEILNKRYVKKLNSIIPILESDNVVYKSIKKLDRINQASFKEAITKWSYGIVSGFNSWDYSLNNNYKRLLKPADFTFTKGKGYFVAVQAQKSLNKKFSLIGNFGFETVYSKSGHNSEINYDPLNENNETISTFDLKMASTMGFIDANIEILRQSDVSIDATTVTIDLNNKHKISSVDLSAYLSAKLLTVNNFSASTSLGIGIAQIVKVKNELASFTTSLKELRPHKS